MKFPIIPSISFASFALALSACASAPPAPAPVPPEPPLVATAEPAASDGVPAEPVEEPVPTPTPTPVAVDLMAVEMAAYQAAKPVFEEQCESCHLVAPGKKASKGAKHFAMGSYPFGGHHASELATTIRTSLGATGKPATMPKDDPGAVQGEELKLVLAWADAFDEASAAKVGHHSEQAGGHHDHGAKHEHKAKKKPKKKKKAKKKHGHSEKHEHSHKH